MEEPRDRGLVVFALLDDESPRRFILTSYSSASANSIFQPVADPEGEVPVFSRSACRRMQRDASSRIDLFTAHALTTPSTARWGNLNGIGRLMPF